MPPNVQPPPPSSLPSTAADNIAINNSREKLVVPSYFTHNPSETKTASAPPSSALHSIQSPSPPLPPLTSNSIAPTTGPIRERQPKPPPPKQKRSDRSTTRASTPRSGNRIGEARSSSNNNGGTGNTGNSLEDDPSSNNYNNDVGRSGNITNSAMIQGGVGPEMYGASGYGGGITSPYTMGMGMGMGGGYGMGMGGMGTGGMGMVSKLNNYLFGFQSVVFSLGQAMQILGMNTQALHQLYHQFTTGIDRVLSTLHEMQTMSLEKSASMTSEDEIKRRRRLKAMRWSLMLAATYASYSIVRGWLRRRREFLMAKEGVGRIVGRSGITAGVGALERGGGGRANYYSSDRGRGTGVGSYQLGNNSSLGPYNGGGDPSMTPGYGNGSGYGNGGYQGNGMLPTMNSGPYSYDRYQGRGGGDGYY